MTDQPGNITLKLALEQAALAQSAAGVDKLDKQFATLKTDVQATGAAADKSAAAIGKAMGGLQTNVEANIKAVNELRKGLGQAADEAQKVKQAGGFGIEGLRRTGGALSALGLGGLGGDVTKVGDIAQVAKEFQQLASAGKGLSGVLGGVVTAIGPAGLALGALSLGLKVFSDGMVHADEQTKRVSEQITAYYQALATGTTESLRAKIQQLEAEKRINDAELKDREANLSKVRDKELAAARASNDFWDELGVELEQAGLRGSALTEKIKELKGKSADTQAQIDGLKAALGDSAVAANDAAKAEERLALERLKAIDKSKAHQIELADLAANGTAEQLQKKIADAKRTQSATAEAYWKALDDANQTAATAAAARKSSQDKTYLAQLDETIAKGLTAAKGSREKAAAQQAQIIKDQITSPAYLQALDDAAKKSADFAAGLKKDYEGAASDLKDFENLLPQLEIKGFFDKLKKGVQDGIKESGLQQAGDDLKKQIEEALKRDERVAAVQQKYNDQSAAIEERDKEARLASFEKYENTVQGIEEKSQQARADLQTRYADQLVDIARKTADEAAKALQGLEQKQADLRTGLGRDEAKAGREAADKLLDIQVKAQREEKVALQEHLQRLKEIRHSDYAQDQKDLLDRNFANIYLRRLAQSQQMEQENTKFGQDRAKREQTIQNEVQDAQRAAQITRRERLISYEQANADARLAYQRERAAAEVSRQQALRDAAIAHTRELEQQRLAKERELRAANAAYGRELTDLTAKLNHEKVTLNNAYDAELKLATLYGKARVEAERQTQQKLLAQANARLTALSGGTVSHGGHGVMERAVGGPLEAGQVSWVNEQRRESWNGAAFPGPGLFIPAAAGSVNPNGGGGGNMTNHFYISAHDTEGVSREVLRVMKQVMN